MTFSRRNFILGSLASASLMQSKTHAFAAALENTGLKNVYQDDFLIGTAISTTTFANNDTRMLALIKREFNAVTTENALKWASIHPALDQWQWDIADKFVDFGRHNRMYVVGHTLVWHGQVPPAVFVDQTGKQREKKALLARMDEHIQTLVGRYKGRIAAWDVVNEAIEDDGQWRKSPWYTITATDYIERAFHVAHAIDPKAHLIYNDYSMFLEKKRDAVVAMVKNLKKKGVPIHGVGMQGHVGMAHPDLAELEKSILAFAAIGVRVHITELDVDVLPSAWAINGAEISTRFEYQPELNPYREGLPAAMEEKLARRYEALFRLFLKHRDKIARVATWGTSDDASWLNNFPVVGRTNYPLLFDREQRPKAAYHRLIQLKH